MAVWQIVLLVFFLVLPVTLMLDRWGDERVTFRGRPVQRDWRRQVEHAVEEDH